MPVGRLVSDPAQKAKVPRSYGTRSETPLAAADTMLTCDVLLCEGCSMEAAMSNDPGNSLSAALLLIMSFYSSAAWSAGSSTNAHAQLDQPSARETSALSADEQKKLKEELTKARDRQNARVTTKEAPAPKSKKP